MANMERSTPAWRLPLAIILIVANMALIGANLSKFGLLPFAEEGEDDLLSSGTTVPAEIEEDEEQTTEVTVADEPAAGEVEDIDDWPGGRGPVPEEPAQGRQVIIAPDGSALVTGSAPSWATASQVVELVAANLGTEVGAIDNQLAWHPDGATDVQSGTVLIEQAATFALGQSEIDPTSIPTLDFVAGLLKARPAVFAVVIGHTDDVGDEELNAELASTRAGVVVDYLASQGVVPAQLVVASAGEDAPVASNDTVEGRQFNRRIELQFKNFLVPPGEIG